MQFDCCRSEVVFRGVVSELYGVLSQRQWPERVMYVAWSRFVGRRSLSDTTPVSHK